MVSRRRPGLVLWRVGNYVSLNGIGGLLTAARWHTKGCPIVYCAQNPSTALLENLVHFEIDAEDRPSRFRVLKIEGPDSLALEIINPPLLPADWTSDVSVTQGIGDRWLAECRSLLLQVPSVLVPETWNILINPAHPQIEQLEIVGVYDHPFDPRLIK